MQVIKDISLFNSVHPVATIGIFDGVHMGHKEILKRLNELAAIYHGESVVITLWPHPREILQPLHKKFRLLTTLNEKIALIEKQNIQNLIVVPFTRELSNIPFDRFIQDYLVNMMKVKHLVIGFNHHFGRDRKGSHDELQKMAGKHNFTVEKRGPVIISENRVSSSGIRHMIEEGRIRTANEALGYNYFINGKVVKGNQIGRLLGFPTANIEINDPNKLIPLNGVYAVGVILQGKAYQGMMNIGIRPTLEMPKHEQTLEVHIFDFDKDIYGQVIQVQFHEWMRCEKKFNKMEELREQLGTDKKEVLKIFHT